MAIDAVNPTVIEQGATFDKLWVTRLNIDAPSPRRPVRASFEVRKSRVLESGVHQFSPIDPPAQVALDDVYVLAAQRAAAGKPALATALQAVLAAVAELAAEQGQL